MYMWLHPDKSRNDAIEILDKKTYWLVIWYQNRQVKYTYEAVDLSDATRERRNIQNIWGSG